MKRILVTGGAGFIGSALVRHLVAGGACSVLNCDSLAYAGRLENLESIAGAENYRFARLDIRDREGLREAFSGFRPDAVVHLAAQTHVDRSIDSPLDFVDTNLAGTATLLESVRDYWGGLPPSEAEGFRYLQVSTDEVFGTLGEAGSFAEDSPYVPRSPYAASKAGADHLARAWGTTYGVPVLVSCCCNNYGPFQFPEKLIPSMAVRILSGAGSLPIYGSGRQVREWIHVDDHIRALLAILELGTPGETYAVGSGEERTNLELVESVCAILDELCPSAKGRYAERIVHVEDRPGHDCRYALRTEKLRTATHWYPRIPLKDGLRQTLLWYINHPHWWQPLVAEACARRGSGL